MQTLKENNQYTNQSAAQSALVAKSDELAKYVSYYGLALTIGWIGLLKFTAPEAEGIAPFVANSPFLSWAYGLVSHQVLSNVLGSVELIVATLIALRPVNPKLSAIGGFLATGMFLTTLSFVLSTPGAISGVIFGVVPALSVPGQFLLKDIVLLGVALQVLTDSVKAIKY